MYKGSADWTLIGRLKENPRITIPIFGNGDIDSPEKALEYKNRYGVDGIMIGRAAIGYPWFFNEVKHFLQTGEKLPAPDINQRVEVCMQHLDFSLRWKGKVLGLIEMRRHYTNYFKHIPDFKPFRMKLVTSGSADEVIETLEEIKQQFSFFEVG
jgi:tRNA-dihydrouridine synthase